MNRICFSRCRSFSKPSALLMAAILMLGLTGCNNGPGTPSPPQNPPRPVTSSAGGITTTHFELSARPMPPSPGFM